MEVRSDWRDITRNPRVKIVNSMVIETSLKAILCVRYVKCSFEHLEA